MPADRDLEAVLGALCDKLPTNDKDMIVLSSQNLPQLPEQMVCGKLLIMLSETAYSGVRRDYLEFEAESRTYQLLALALLAKIFHEGPPLARIKLTHPASDIREIVLDYEHNLENCLTVAEWYETRPYQYRWGRSPPDRAYSWGNYRPTWGNRPNRALPAFALMTRRGEPVNKPDWQERDLLHCAGTDEGHVFLADTLLNLGHPNENPEQRIKLEGERVYHVSPEAQFRLPGSWGWSGKL
jgi:hypothetical protein